MCLNKLTAISVSEKGTLTLYKVYRKHNRRLLSPYFTYHSGGWIEKPGTYEADLGKTFLAQRQRQSIVPMPPNNTNIGDMDVDISGFHCFTSLESALIYKQVVLVSEYPGTGHPIIIPVLAEAADVFAVGYTGENYKLLTYVVKSITITPEAFAAAFKE